jgi:hypothetical protein
MHYLAFHYKWPLEQIQNLSPKERRTWCMQLSEHFEAERDAYENARKK